MERNLSIPGPTTAHAEPNLTKTIKKMVGYCCDHRPNKFVAGRETAYVIPDMMDKGQDLVHLNVQDDEGEIIGEGEATSRKAAIEGEDIAVI